MKRFAFAQAGIINPLVVFAVVGVVAFVLLSQTASFKNNVYRALFSKDSSFAATTNPDPFTNMTAQLKANSATFSFNFSKTSTSMVVAISTKSNMNNPANSPFGTGKASPIIVANPMSKWKYYTCGTTMYWRVTSTYKGTATKSSIQTAKVDCSVGVGTTTPMPTPTATSAPKLATPPPNPTSFTRSGADGSWCYDFDGSEASGIEVGYSTQGFCQDNTGIKQDFCDASSNAAEDYYCGGTWDGSKWSHVGCEVGGYTCAVGSYLGDYCTRGACAPGSAPSPVPAATTPPTHTMSGNDGTWCNDSDGNSNLFTQGTCQDTKGIYTDYCNGSDNVQDYYCAGDWNGQAYKNVRCEVGTHGCTSQIGYDLSTGNPYVCLQGSCVLSSSNSTPVPAITPTPTAAPTPLPSASPSKRVFVTSTFNNGNLGGLAGADNICKLRAQATSLGGTWKAWLSDSNTSASSRLSHSNSPYVRLDGMVVANDWADLTDGSLQNAIKINEFSQDESNYMNAAWTGTSTSGAASSPNCSNWTDGTYAAQGVLGGISSAISYWTYGASPTSVCSNSVTLYCIEQ